MIKDSKGRNVQAREQLLRLLDSAIYEGVNLLRDEDFKEWEQILKELQSIRQDVAVWSGK